MMEQSTEMLFHSMMNRVQRQKYVCHLLKIMAVASQKVFLLIFQKGVGCVRSKVLTPQRMNIILLAPSVHGKFNRPIVVSAHKVAEHQFLHMHHPSTIIIITQTSDLPIIMSMVIICIGPNTVTKIMTCGELQLMVQLQYS